MWRARMSVRAYVRARRVIFDVRRSMFAVPCAKPCYNPEPQCVSQVSLQGAPSCMAEGVSVPPPSFLSPAFFVLNGRGAEGSSPEGDITFECIRILQHDAAPAGACLS